MVSDFLAIRGMPLSKAILDDDDDDDDTNSKGDPDWYVSS